VITPTSVITVHYEPIEALKNFHQKTAETSLMMFYRIIEAILKFQDRQVTHIGQKTEAIGRLLFKEQEREVSSASRASNAMCPNIASSCAIRPGPPLAPHKGFYLLGGRPNAVFERPPRRPPQNHESN